MPLACHKKLDMSVDRGRILPLGGRAQSSDGFRNTEKIVDKPNPYNRFSRRDRIAPSARNDSLLTARSGAMSAEGEIAYKGGKRNLPSTQGGSNSFQNDDAQFTPRKGGKFMTHAEEKMIRDRIWAEDHPRKLVKHAPAPDRPALDSQGRSPFITANGMIGKSDVSPNKAQKNRNTEQVDLDSKSQARMRAMSSGATPQRYRSPFRDAAMNREKSPLIPNSLPLHPEIEKGGLAKQQRFGLSKRATDSSLNGVFHPAPQKAPPPYKLVAPFYTSES